MAAPEKQPACDSTEFWNDCLYNQLISSGQRDLRTDLARLRQWEALVRESAGDLRGAVALYCQANEVYERLVHQEGQRELTGNLAWVQLDWADVANELGQRDDARRVARQAARILESEVQRTGRADLQNVLNWARRNMADLL